MPAMPWTRLIARFRGSVLIALLVGLAMLLPGAVLQLFVMVILPDDAFLSQGRVALGLSIGCGLLAFLRSWRFGVH